MPVSESKSGLDSFIQIIADYYDLLFHLLSVYYSSFYWAMSL